MKRSVLCLLCVLTLLCSLGGLATTAEAASVPGDLDGSGTVTDYDAIYLLMYSFFPEEYPIADASAFDYDRNGSVDADDAIYLLMYTFFPASYPIAPPADTRVIDGKTYTITFVDEFDGTKLDTKKWAICPAGQRGDAKVKARWADSMVAVKNGALVITAEAGSDGTYVCGGVRTLSKNYSRVIWSQCKGYFECRCRLPDATGCIGAFWLMTRSMNNNDVGQGATNGAEIDILESFSVARGGINHAVHWDGYGSSHQCKDKRIYDRSYYTGFHTYGMAWTDDEYIFFVDGKETWRIGNKNVADIVCLDPAYMKLTVEFGEWAGIPTASAFPTQFVIDYVRVYQLAD